MYRSIARLMIVLMLWNTVVFAQGTARESEEGTTGAKQTAIQPTPTLIDPAVVDYRTGRRLVRGLDRPVDPDTYVVGPTDQFILFVRGPQERKIELRVLPEGTVQLPNVGAVKVAGMTISEMRAMLDDRLEPYYRNIAFDCQLIVPRTLIVYVLGEVGEPGPVELYAPFRLDMALQGAGGVTDRGSQRAIDIVVDGQVEETVDYFSFLRLGELDQNPSLREGVTVFVRPRDKSCSVVGEVWRSGRYDLLEGETVGDIVELAGGLTPSAFTDRIVIERLDANDRLSTSEQTWDEAASRTLQDRDVVVVPDRQSFPGTDFVRVYGGGGREGIIPIQPGETMETFLPRLARLRRNHNLSAAVIERTLPSGEMGYIPVDLEALIEGRGDGSLALQAGDVIGIPPYEEAVFVIGEVVQPGPIAYQRGLPAERYVALAGGPGNTGSIDRLEIISRDGEKRGAGRNSTVYQGETIVVKTKRSRIFQTVFVGLTSLTSLVLSIIAVSRTN